MSAPTPVVARTALVADSFYRAAGYLPAGWQLAVEDWRPGRGRCGRCQRPAEVIAVVVYPAGRRVERLAESCLAESALPSDVLDAGRAGLRAAREFGRSLHQTSPGQTSSTAAELAHYDDRVATACEAGLRVPEAWLAAARARRTRQALLEAAAKRQVPEDLVPSTDALRDWDAQVARVPPEIPAAKRLADLGRRLHAGDATPAQVAAALKLLATPWEDLVTPVPGSWASWGVWPHDLERSRARRRERLGQPVGE